MRLYTVVLLFCFFWLYSVECRIFVWTGKSTTTRWSDPINWQCKDCGPGNFLPTDKDDVQISNDNSVFTQVGVFNPSKCYSLSLNGRVNFTIYSDLVVGLGGIESSESSFITLTNYLSSQGNVNVKGTCFWLSGEAHGPGDYSFETLQASVCHIYAHVDAETVTLSSQITTVDIQIYQNAWLTVNQLTVNNNSVISGNISANFLQINYNLTLTGSVIQKFAHVTLDNDFKKVLTPKLEAPIIINHISIPTLYQVFVYSPDANIIAEGDGNIFIFPLANVILQSGLRLGINSAGNLTLNTNSANNINITGGFLNALRNSGNIISISGLNVSRATLVGYMNVDTLVLGEGSVLLGIVTAKNADISGSQNHAGILTITNAIFENSVISSFEDVNGIIINSGKCTINGNFICSSSIKGSGDWNVNGNWLVKGVCDVSGSIILNGNSVLKLESNKRSYAFGKITGGSIAGDGDGYFSAKDVNVNLFLDHFSSVKIDSLSTKNYTSKCCSSKEISKINKMDILMLEEGSYKFSVQNLLCDISYLKLSDGVTLEILTSNYVSIHTFDFFGGTFSSPGSNVQLNKVNMIGKSQKNIDSEITTNILDWTKCDGDCGISHWSYFLSSYCVCDCTQCDSCAPCSNDDDDCSPCSLGCSCDIDHDCECPQFPNEFQLITNKTKITIE